MSDSKGGYGQTSSVGIFSDTGSRYETKEKNGVAHYVEHLSFKGTQRRSRIDIEKDIENIGAHLNAYIVIGLLEVDTRVESRLYIIRDASTKILAKPWTF